MGNLTETKRENTIFGPDADRRDPGNRAESVAKMLPTFVIRTAPANRDGSLPEHYDIYLKGNDDSIATIWDSLEMAEEFVRFLDQYPARRAQAGAA